MPYYTYVIAVYATSMASGGPEEGGWWYEEGLLEAFAMVPTIEDRDRIGEVYGNIYRPDHYRIITWRDTDPSRTDDDEEYNNFTLREYADDSLRPVPYFPKERPYYS